MTEHAVVIAGGGPTGLVLATELAVPIYRGREVTGFAQDHIGVDVELSDGPSPRAEYLVGCGGGGSPIRKAADIEFPGWDPTASNLITEVELAEEPAWGLRRDALGIHALSRMGDGPVRVLVTEQGLGRTIEPKYAPIVAAARLSVMFERRDPI